MRKLIPLLLMTAACTSAASAPPPAAPPMAAAVAPAPSAGIAGTYAVRQVNGKPLPTPSPMEPNVELTSGTLQLNSDASFVITLGGRKNQEPTPGNEHMRGTYAVTGDVIALTTESGGGPRFNYTLSGATLTLRDDSGVVWVLERQ